MPRADVRPRDRLGRVAPHNPLAGKAGVVNLARAIPGFWALWEKRVPQEYLSRDGEAVHIACPCKARVSLDEGFVECGCGRWFLRAGEDDVRVKRFATDGLSAETAHQRASGGDDV